MTRALLLALVMIFVTCGPAAASRSLLVGTTTTTQDTGLLDAIGADFTRHTGLRARFVVAGSGQTLQTAGRGDVDVVLVHSPSDELAFIGDGNGIDRRLVMHDDFIVLGPASDPARIRGLAAVPAFRALAASAAPFVSRGDGSGTNVKELALWKAAGVDPKGKAWYAESAAGQLATLQLAAQRRAYVFADRGTWLANQKLLPDLAVLVDGGPELLNVYHVIRVSPVKFPKVDDAGAKAFADYLTGADGQRFIASFGVDRFGVPLFTPDAGKNEADLR